MSKLLLGSITWGYQNTKRKEMRSTHMPPLHLRVKARLVCPFGSRRIWTRHNGMERQKAPWIKIPWRGQVGDVGLRQKLRVWDRTVWSGRACGYVLCFGEQWPCLWESTKRTVILESPHGHAVSCKGTRHCNPRELTSMVTPCGSERQWPRKTSVPFVWLLVERSE